MDERVSVGRGRTEFQNGLRVLGTNPERARAHFTAAAATLRPLAISAQPLIRRDSHLGMVLAALAVNDATTANTHLNWLLHDGWDPTLPAIQGAVEEAGRTLTSAGWDDEAKLAAALALRVKVTIRLLVPASPPVDSVVTSAQAVRAPVVAVGPAPAPLVPVEPMASPVAAVDAGIGEVLSSVAVAGTEGVAGSSRRRALATGRPRGRRCTGGPARRAVRASGPRLAAATSILPALQPMPAAPGPPLGDAQRAVAVLGRVIDGHASAGPWIVRGRRIVWIDPMGRDDDDAPESLALLDGIRSGVTRIARVLGRAAQA